MKSYLTNHQVCN